jgi:hypothetical protein
LLAAAIFPSLDADYALAVTDRAGNVFCDAIVPVLNLPVARTSVANDRAVWRVVVTIFASHHSLLAFDRFEPRGDEIEVRSRTRRQEITVKGVLVTVTI